MKHLVEAIVSAARDEGMCVDLADQFRLRVEKILVDWEGRNDDNGNADQG